MRIIIAHYSQKGLGPDYSFSSSFHLIKPKAIVLDLDTLVCEMVDCSLVKGLNYTFFALKNKFSGPNFSFQRMFGQGWAFQLNNLGHTVKCAGNCIYFDDKCIFEVGKVKVSFLDVVLLCQSVPGLYRITFRGGLFPVNIWFDNEAGLVICYSIGVDAFKEVYLAEGLVEGSLKKYDSLMTVAAKSLLLGNGRIY